MSFEIFQVNKLLKDPMGPMGYTEGNEMMRKAFFMMCLLFLSMGAYQPPAGAAVSSGEFGGVSENKKNPQPREDLFQGWDMEGLARDLARDPLFESYYQRAKAELLQGRVENQTLIQRPLGRPQQIGKGEDGIVSPAAVPQQLPSDPGSQIPSVSVPRKQQVDLYFSFTCSYCWTAWERLRADGMQRLHEKGDSINFHVRPLVGTSDEALLGLLFDKLQSLSPEKSYAFLDFVSQNKYSIGQDRFLGEINIWMLENVGMDIKTFAESIDEGDRRKLLVYDQEFKAAGGDMTPTIVVDGTINNTFFD